MKKVLIIEDDQFLADAYSAKLSHFSNITIDFARDGEEAVVKINADKPDAIILDLVMPNMDGYDFLKKLRDHATNIPILVSSNLDSRDDVRRAIELGAQDYFIKSDSTVKDIVDKVISIIK